MSQHALVLAVISLALFAGGCTEEEERAPGDEPVDFTIEELMERPPTAGERVAIEGARVPTNQGRPYVEVDSFERAD